MNDMRMLGDFILVKQIGQGSFGQAWVAEHRFTKKTYVVKMLPEELSNDRNFLQRFEDEIAQLASLEHPNIAKVYNVSFSQGVYFLVTECVVDQMGETTNLSQYFSSKEKKLSEDEVLTIVTQIACALDYGHSIKDSKKEPLIHRSLKLNNILIGANKDKKPHVVISDWGLSSIIGVGQALTRTFKGVAEALGIAHLSLLARVGKDRYSSPHIETQKLLPLHQSFVQNFCFLAPEQKKVELKASPACDAYAFGVLCYYLLTGVYPEGAFSMPSKLVDCSKLNWDIVIERTMQPYPLLREVQLVKLLEQAKKNNKTAELSKTVESPKPVDLFEPAVIPVEKQVQDEISEVMTAARTQPVQMKPVQMNPVQMQSNSRAPWGVQERVVMEYAPAKHESKESQPILTDMVTIPEGLYHRGSNSGCRDEMPKHQIELSAFAMDIHPVTNEQFVRFLEAVGGEKDAQHHDIIRLKDSRIKKSAGRFNIDTGYNKHPVVGVSWYGAVAYCQWVGKRLPTEAEWEIACQGGVESPLYPTGGSIEKKQANFFSSDTTSVMSYPPNEYGLYDMAGNVYEWCQDWYEYAFYEVSQQEPNNPKGPMQGVYRVLRGGCWKSLQEDLRTSKRHRNNPGAINGTYGFRCAKSIY